MTQYVRLAHWITPTQRKALTNRADGEEKSESQLLREIIYKVLKVK